MTQRDRLTADAQKMQVAIVLGVLLQFHFLHVAGLLARQCSMRVDMSAIQVDTVILNNPMIQEYGSNIQYSFHLRETFVGGFALYKVDKSAAFRVIRSRVFAENSEFDGTELFQPRLQPITIGFER